MNTFYTKLFLFPFALVLLTSSCATGYDQIQPHLINYVSKSTSLDNVQLKYKYDVLTKKYKKKAERSGIQMVAVQITNNSNEDLIFGENLVLKYDNGNNAVILDRAKAIREIKQTVPTYLLYLLLTPVNLYITETDSNGFQQETSSTPIGLVLGPALTAINLFTASGGNSKLKSELANNELMGQVIKPGDVAIGLVALRSNTYDALRLEVVE